MEKRGTEPSAEKIRMPYTILPRGKLPKDEEDALHKRKTKKEKKSEKAGQRERQRPDEKKAKESESARKTPRGPGYFGKLERRQRTEGEAAEKERKEGKRDESKKQPIRSSRQREKATEERKQKRRGLGRTRRRLRERALPSQELTQKGNFKERKEKKRQTLTLLPSRWEASSCLVCLRTAFRRPERSRQKKKVSDSRKREKTDNKSRGPRDKEVSFSSAGEEKFAEREKSSKSLKGRAYGLAWPTACPATRSEGVRTLFGLSSSSSSSRAEAAAGLRETCQPRLHASLQGPW